MQNILITGSNKGLGFEMARQFLLKGFHVIISGRDKDRLSEAFNQLNHENASIDMVVMDINEFESVKHAALIISQKNIKLDILINNAAILLKEDRSLIDHDDEILKTTINTNCFGTVRVIHAFLPLMKSPGRIINLSSEGGSMSELVGGWAPAYCVSKTMLNSITRHLAYELSGLEISVNAISPGWVKTDMGGKSAPRTVEKGAESVVWLATEAPQKLTGKFIRDKKEISW